MVDQNREFPSYFALYYTVRFMETAAQMEGRRFSEWIRQMLEYDDGV